MGRLRGGCEGELEDSFSRGSNFYMNMTEVIVVPFQEKGEKVVHWYRLGC